ncbi:MAG: 50S ribosomal protein L2 [Candidatus Berkelbacteria bacterium]
MPVKISKPTTNGRRLLSVRDFSGLDTKVKSEKSLTFALKKSLGKSGGKIVCYHKGGGVKRLYRMVDFLGTERLGEKATVISIQYDPNRSADIALIQYEDKTKVYIIAPAGLEKGTTLVCDEKTPIRAGNRMKLKNIPSSTQIYGVELVQGKGAQMCRSAGTFATLLGVDGDYAMIRLPSSESRKVLAENYASIGIVSNIDHNKIVFGKAGRKRKLGIRPTVLGKSKNACDHPHGGGEGHSPIGNKKGPRTPWGKAALGPRTRNKKKKSGKLILSRRSK